MYLATTALSEFWDKNQKILFLGSWCLLHDKHDEWKDLDYEVMENPWNNRELFYEAGLYTDQIYEKYLKKLSLLLNETHNVNFDENYWRIIIGPWLFHYIEAFYDRYCHICKAFDQYPDLETWLLSPDDYITPHLLGDFFYLYTEDDWYNLQLYSQILVEMGCDLPVLSFKRNKKGSRNLKKLTLTSLKKNLFKSIHDIVKDILHSLCWLKTEQKVVLADIHLSWINVLRLIFFSRGLVFWNISIPDRLLDCEYDSSKRQDLFNSLNGYDGEFERILVKSFSVNFPSLYLEGYQGLRDIIKQNIKQTSHAVLSSTGWYFNEGFKFYASEVNNCGALLYGYQHGGGYGQLKNTSIEKHEIKLSEMFYTWGWESQDSPSKTKPLPKPFELKPREKTRNNLGAKDILVICTNHPRYLYRLHSCPVGSQFDDYIEDEKRFVHGIGKEFYSNLVFRLYPYDYQRNIKDRITIKFPDLHFDGRKSYLQSIKKARVVVVDHLATTFLLTLASNIPTILFWNPRYWEVRYSAQPFFDKLRQIGILHDTPESAAAKINEVYEDINAWWHQVELQKAKDEFCWQFARTSNNWLKDWKTELYNLANKLED